MMKSMLDILAYEDELIRWIDAHRPEIFRQIAEAEALFRQNQIEFRNVAYPVYPRLALLRPDFARQAARLGESMLNILEKVIWLYENDEDTRRYFDLPAYAERACCTSPGYSRKIRISRFDTFPQGSAPLKILENNTDCPAGVIFNGRVVQLMLQVSLLHEFVQSRTARQADPIVGPDAFIEALLATFNEFMGSSASPSCVCILQQAERISAEVREVARILTSLGMKVVIADPRTLAFEHGRLMTNSTAIDLVWNKINTVDFERLDPARTMTALFRAYQERAVCHVNSFAARYITENKLCAAYLCEDYFRTHFTSPEVELIKKIIPWTRRLADATVDYEGRTWPLLELAINHRDQFVLKAPYDIRGNGVTIGHSTNPDSWSKLLTQHWNTGYTLQAFQEPPVLPIVERPDGPWVWKKFSLDLFMFNGKFQGFGSKMADGDKLNLFQGGSKLPIFQSGDPI